MPLDAICLHAVLEELRPQILGTKIEKIQQPDKDKFLLRLRGKTLNGKLLLTAGTGNARIHLTNENYESPQTAPMFCMLLRKHLSGGRIKEIVQLPFERVVRMKIDSYDELGELQEKELVLELLGSYCNLILLDGEGMILGTLRRLEHDLTRERAILPGLLYHPPTPQEKTTPLALEEISEADIPEDKALDKWLLEHYKGISPLVARELVYQTFGQTDAQLNTEKRARFVEVLHRFAANIHAGVFTPYLFEKTAGAFDFSYLPITQYAADLEHREYESFSELLDSVFKSRNVEEKRRQQAGALTKKLTTLCGKIERKLALQKEEQITAQKREQYRERGDLITANFHLLKGGESVLRTENFYDPDGGQVEIPLDPLKTPQQNAAAYYKRYTKLKTAEQHLVVQMEKAEQELEYLESVLESIDKAEGSADVLLIREELTDAGYLRKQSGKKQKIAPSQPMEFLSSGGFRIFAGKNNLQNDSLTFKQAHKGDIWLHTQKIHGSHVIIASAGAAVDEKTLHEAATIAAYYSKGKDGSNVPVDYTAVKFVKKPAGSKAGAAHYTNQSTIFVTPDAKLVEQLRTK